MNERAFVSRDAVIVAGIAAILTFLAAAGLRNIFDRAPPKGQKVVSTDKSKPVVLPTAAPSTARANLQALDLDEDWTPPPVEFVKLTAAVSLYNSRGKEVKQFLPGKRFKVIKREGDQITIDYLGDEYIIAAKSTAPSG